MSVVKELIRTEADGGISFGDYELAAKAKKSDFEHRGDLYKVKTFKEITKLERNGLTVTVRREMGRDIDGACGQLRRKHMHKEQHTGQETGHVGQE